ncbi:hypothetical protein D9M68_914210 [compost metagenome]
MDLRQVATERAAQAEGPGGSVQRSLEVAQVLAIGVGDFAVEAAQRHLRLVDQRIEAMPGEIQPGDFRFGAQAFAPVHLTAEFQALLSASIQIQAGDLRAIGVHGALQQQRHRPFFGGERRLAEQLIAVFQIAFAGQFQLIEQ